MTGAWQEMLVVMAILSHSAETMSAARPPSGTMEYHKDVQLPSAALPCATFRFGQEE